jgi:hypothetical protein
MRALRLSHFDLVDDQITASFCSDYPGELRAMLNILRWIAILPGSIICATLSAFPLHLVLYQTLTASGIIEPYPEGPEHLLGPFAAALAFVWAGSRIAPSRKVETAVVLFGTWLWLAGAALALGLVEAHIGNLQFHLRSSALAPAGAIIGASVGLYLTRREKAGLTA